MAKVENKIILKVENEIITNFEIKHKILSTLVLSKEEVNQKNINKLKRQAIESLIQLKLKKIELSRYNILNDEDKIIAYLNSISSNDIIGLKKEFIKNQLDFDLFLEEVKIQFKWQKLIYEIYSKRIEVIFKFIKDFITNEGFIVKVLNNCAVPFRGVRTKDDIIICSPTSYRSLGDLVYILFHEMSYNNGSVHIEFLPL